MLAARFGAIAAAGAQSGSSAITLAAIDAWATDAASGGAISSASGGTMPTVMVDVDPTPYVTGATGTKAGWSAQFQGSTLGTWSRIGNGDYRFTPGSSPGTDNAEYRVSDDGGITWSEWTPISIEVVARPPGPFFLIEDYGGSDQAKIEAAADAASAAGGTVTTLQRATIWSDVNQLDPENAHFLGVMIKHRPALHTSTGDLCGENTGSDKCSGWNNGYFSRTIECDVAAPATRQEWVLCDVDGTMQKQAVHTTQGPGGTPAVCGVCFENIHSDPECFNLQRQEAFRAAGINSAGASNRRKMRWKRCKIHDTCGDGISCSGSGDLQIYDTVFENTFRGAWVLNGGNTVADIQRCVVIPGSHGAGIDYEAFGYGGNEQCISTATDCIINSDFDVKFADGSNHTFTRCTVGPGVHWLGSDASICAMVDCEVRFVITGGGGGGSFPRERIWGLGDEDFDLTFNGVTFVAWGDDFVYHSVTKQPSLGSTWQIGLLNCAAGTVRFINVTLTSHNVPGGSTIRLLNASTAEGTGSVVRLDGVTIGAEYVQDAFKLNGQTCEYRNVTHLGFPGATIQQIAPGASSYVGL